MKELHVQVKKVQKKPEEPATLKKDRWYYVEIYPRDLEEAQGRFVGKLIAEEKDERVLQDQDDFVSAYSETADIRITLAGAVGLPQHPVGFRQRAGSAYQPFR